MENTVAGEYLRSPAENEVFVILSGQKATGASIEDYMRAQGGHQTASGPTEIDGISWVRFEVSGGQGEEQKLDKIVSTLRGYTEVVTAWDFKQWHSHNRPVF